MDHTLINNLKNIYILLLELIRLTLICSNISVNLTYSSFSSKVKMNHLPHLHHQFENSKVPNFFSPIYSSSLTLLPSLSLSFSLSLKTPNSPTYIFSIMAWWCDLAYDAQTSNMMGSSLCWQCWFKSTCRWQRLMTLMQLGRMATWGIESSNKKARDVLMCTFSIFKHLEWLSVTWKFPLFFCVASGWGFDKKRKGKNGIKRKNRGSNNGRTLFCVVFFFSISIKLVKLKMTTSFDWHKHIWVNFLCDNFEVLA